LLDSLLQEIYSMREICLVIMLGVLGVLGSRDMEELQDFERMMAEPRDRSGWVDPLDMGLYDPKQNTCPELVDRLGKCERELAMAKTKVVTKSRNPNNSHATTTAESPGQTTPVPDKSVSEVFLRRHVTHLLSRLGLSSTIPAHLKVEILLTPYEVQTLHNFASSQSTVHAVDVDHILSSFIKSYDAYETSPWIEVVKINISSMKDPLLVVLLSLALLYVMVSGLRRLPAFHVFWIILLLSVCWHWVHMYKATWAAKHSKLMQSTEIPAECRPQEMTWYQTIRASASSLVSSVDKCEEYHKAMLVDPIYEVNPATALVDLVTKIILHPLSSLGKEVGSMFTGLLGEVPLLWKVPVLLLFVILLMFVMILFAGYEVRLPLFLGKIGPANNGSGTENTALHQQISELKSMITSMKSGSMAVEGGDERYLEFEGIKKTSVTRQVSGVEDLVPIGYDCHQKKHTSVDSQIMTVDPGTPRRTRVKQNRILTPVKSRVMSQPDLFHKDTTSELKESESAENLVLDLTRKRSDSFPSKSPVKSLLVKDCESPKSTKFEWISTEEFPREDGSHSVTKELLFDERERESQELSSNDEPVEPSSNFLNKVEDLFKPQEEE